MDDLSQYESSLISEVPDTSQAPHVVVLADGDYPHGEIAAALLAGAQNVVCCDGAALAFTQRGGVPYAIVGDCDSLPVEFSVRYADIMHRDSDQESNDQTKAVMLCLRQGFSDIIILGATGKREDHTLGNIGLLPGYTHLPGVRSVRMVTDRGVFDVISRPTRFSGPVGQQVSIICPDPQVRITTANLRYPLVNAHLTAWWQGTLNEALAEEYGVGTTGDTLVFRLF